MNDIVRLCHVFKVFLQAEPEFTHQPDQIGRFYVRNRDGKMVPPREFGYEWSGLTLQQKKSEGEAGVIFGMAILFVFLLLAAQYESWALPFAVSAMHTACRAGNLRRVGNGQLR